MRPDSIRETDPAYQAAEAQAVEVQAALATGNHPARSADLGQQNVVKPSYYWTWRLLHDGFTADECQQIRQLDDQQLVAHLLQAVEEELPVDATWILKPDHLEALDRVVGDQPPTRLRPLLQQLPREIRHEHLQLYLVCRGMGFFL